MGYVERSLVSGERIISKAKLPTVDWFGLLPLFIILPIGLYVFIRRRNVEIVVTNRRLIVKKGWIARKTDEISLKRIEEINFQQGVVERIWRYGRVQVHGTGGSGIEIPPIQYPARFRQAIQEAQARADF